jgi:methylenetetrahydrofolate reductase (NADPH)
MSTPTTPDGLNSGLDETAGRLHRRPWPPFTPLRSDLELSFELFPPATPAGLDTMQSCVEQLAGLSPRFVSVTYGAGGSTQDRTFKSLDTILTETQVPAAAHLTCVGKSRADVDAIVDRYVGMGVTHIVALRGDPPEGETDGRHVDGYQSAADLVAGVRRRCDLDISVAAYPEVHPRAASAQADMDNLKRKLDAGATQALTQFFFDADDFLRFFDRARAAGITAPIVPGIMPITNFTKVSGFSQRCGTSVPDWLSELFDGLDELPDVRELVAATVAAEQCRRLLEHGIRSFHFYTMNKPQLTAAVCRILGVRPTSTGTNTVDIAAS